jgi:hypothetical protein
MKRLLSLGENNLWFLSAMTLIIAVVMVAWRIISEQGAGENRLRGPDPLESTQNGAAGSQAIAKVEEQITALSERVGMLTNSSVAF